MLYKENYYTNLLNDYLKAKENINDPSKGYDYFATLLCLYYKFGYGLLSLEPNKINLFSSGNKLCINQSEYFEYLDSADDKLLLGRIVNESNIVHNDTDFANFLHENGVLSSYIDESNSYIFVNDFIKSYGAYQFLTRIKISDLTIALKEIKNLYKSLDTSGKENILNSIFDPVYSLLLMPFLDEKVVDKCLSYLNNCLKKIGTDFYDFIKENKKGMIDQINYFINSCVDENCSAVYKKFIDGINGLKSPKTTSTSKKNEVSTSKSSEPAPTTRTPTTPSRPRTEPTHYGSGSRSVYLNSTSTKLVFSMIGFFLLASALAVGFFFLFKFPAASAYSFFINDPIHDVEFLDWANEFFDFISIDFNSILSLLHYIVCFVLTAIIFILSVICSFLLLILSPIWWLLERIIGVIIQLICILLPYATCVGFGFLFYKINDNWPTYFGDVREKSLTAHLVITFILCLAVLITESVLIWVIRI